MKVSVVIPAYNEEGSIKGIIEGVRSVLGEDAEIIIVDDCSFDSTGSIASSCGAKLLQNPYNMGNGACVKKGIREASNNIVVLMDADGQHVSSEIPLLLNEMDSFDMAVGQRNPSCQALARRIANKIYNILASYVTGVKIKDLTSGFRAFKKDKAMKFLYLLPNSFSYPSTLTLSFIKAAFSVKFVPVKVLPRAKGKSKINLLSDGLRFFIIITRISVFFSPLKIFFPVSAFLFLCGLFYYLYTFVNLHRFTNMSALLFTSSIIIFMLGLISEQVASLRIEKTDS